MPTPIPSAAPSVNIVRGTNGQLVAFLVLNMWTSHFGLPIMLLIVLFSKRVKRHAIFVNLLVAFIITGISSSLLVYANATTGPEPNGLLCLFQSSLLYGMPGLTSTAALTLIIQMFLMIRAAFFGEPYHDSDHMIRLWALLIAPYAAFFAAVLSTAIIGVRDPTKVSRNRRFFYCSVENLTLTNTLTIYSAIVLFATLVIIVRTCVIVYKRWKVLRSQGLELRQAIDLSFPVRIMAFGLYTIVALSLSLLSIKSPSSPIPDLVIASAASVVVLIFGTQKDILSLVLCCKPRPRSMVEDYRIDLKYAFDNNTVQVCNLGSGTGANVNSDGPADQKESDMPRAF